MGTSLSQHGTRERGGGPAFADDRAARVKDRRAQELLRTGAENAKPFKHPRHCGLRGAEGEAKAGVAPMLPPVAAAEQNKEKPPEAPAEAGQEKPAQAPGEVVSLDSFRKK